MRPSIFGTSTMLPPGRDAAGQVVHRGAADCDGRKFSVRERQVDGRSK